MARDWHPPLPGEKPCGPDEWRTRDRNRVIKIAAMDDNHLGHCIRFASTKRIHRSKLDALQAELRRRPGAVAGMLAQWPRTRLDLDEAGTIRTPVVTGRIIDVEMDGSDGQA